MRILFVHNDNLPFSYFGLTQECSIEDYHFSEHLVRKASSDRDDVDTFLTKNLDNLFSSIDVPDLIVIPFSLSQVNPIEYTGIRLAAHIRLSSNDVWKRVPILFNGLNSVDEVLRLSDIGTLLVTPKVFVSQVNTSENLLGWITDNHEKLIPLTDREYDVVVNRFIVSPPENYDDSNHSITNLWNMLRWREMLKWEEGKEPELSALVNEFSFSLYHKWLQVATGTREHFKKKKTKRLPGIPRIQGKKIVHIDDDLLKGWQNILSAIFSCSDAKYCVYCDFNPNQTKDELLKSVFTFLDMHDDADCYIIDLKMHEDDSKTDEYQSYTGHLIAEHLYKKNPGNQVILFTASDKVWNYVYSEKYCSDYIVKEDPTRLLTKEQSNDLFVDFSRAIQKACERSYLKDYYKHCLNNSYLSDFFEILRSDNDNKLHEINMRSAALNLMVYIESTIKGQFQISTTSKILSTSTNAEVYSATDVYIESIDAPDGTKMATKVHVATSQLGHSNWYQMKNDLFLICAVLIKHYGISEYVVEKVIELKNIRNQSIAHGSTYSTINLSLLQQVFSNVVLPMVIKP